MLDAERFGMGPGAIAAIAAAELREAGGGEWRGVWPQNVEAVTAFCLVATQWRTGVKMTGNTVATLWIGLDYAAARAGLELAGQTLNSAVWGRVQVMEVEARRLMNGGGD